VSTQRDQHRLSNTGRTQGSPTTLLSMTTNAILVLVLAMSGALNIGLVAGTLARAAGKSPAAAALIGGGAALTALTVFFTAIAAYH
jgi:hypothetical protein